MKRPYQNFWGKQKIGKDCTFGAFVELGDSVVIGNNCKIEAFAFIPPGVTLEDEVFIGPHVCFTNDKHPKARGEWILLKTLVRQGAAIGPNATIVTGLTIGRNVVVGAGSVVTQDIPDNEVWAGSPAKKIR